MAASPSPQIRINSQQLAPISHTTHDHFLGTIGRCRVLPRLNGHQSGLVTYRTVVFPALIKLLGKSQVGQKSRQFLAEASHSEVSALYAGQRAERRSQPLLTRLLHRLRIPCSLAGPAASLTLLSHY